MTYLWVLVHELELLKSSDWFKIGFGARIKKFVWQECDSGAMKRYNNSECKKPSLEFRLGRAEWDLKED